MMLELNKCPSKNLGVALVVILVFSCNAEKKQAKPESDMGWKAEAQVGYAETVAFMRKYTDIIELSDAEGKAKVAISPALQGRVMTSTARGGNGQSFGWINRELFASGDTLEHINAYGGEERFWLGPEGGQFSIFFEKGSKFTLDNWQTPKLIDTEPFNIKSRTSDEIIFTETASLTNYSAFTFDLAIERKVELLPVEQMLYELGRNNPDNITAVGYRSTNTLTNIGDTDWRKDTGLLSIWLLGMFNPSPSTIIVIPPLISGNESELGIPVNDTYFGKVPAERLIVKDSVIYFRGDGTYRSKIGISPKRAKNVLGSYNARTNVLTIIKYNKPEGVTDYVNSLWEMQEEPYSGDVVNSYNDGAPEPDKKPLGPFFELETSSPALELKAGESKTHIQNTFHISGSENALDSIATQLFGVSLNQIKIAFR